MVGQYANLALYWWSKWKYVLGLLPVRMFIHIVQVQRAYVELWEATFVLQKLLQLELLLLCLFKPLCAFSGAAWFDVNLSASFYGA